MNPTSAAFDLPGKPKKSTANAEFMTNVTNRVLADVRALTPEIRRRAAEIEAGRRVPLDLVQTLRSIGIFRALVPRSHGGLELDMPAAIKIMEAVCKIESSVGSISMIGIGCAIAAVARHTRHGATRHGAPTKPWKRWQGVTRQFTHRADRSHGLTGHKAIRDS